jgi:hypothetical protein
LLERHADTRARPVSAKLPEYSTSSLTLAQTPSEQSDLCCSAISNMSSPSAGCAFFSNRHSCGDVVVVHASRLTSKLTRSSSAENFFAPLRLRAVMLRDNRQSAGDVESSLRFRTQKYTVADGRCLTVPTVVDRAIQQVQRGAGISLREREHPEIEIRRAEVSIAGLRRSRNASVRAASALTNQWTGAACAPCGSNPWRLYARLHFSVPRRSGEK